MDAKTQILYYWSGVVPTRLACRQVTVWVDPLESALDLMGGATETVAVLVGIAVDGIPTAGVIHLPFHLPPSSANETTATVSECRGRTLWGAESLGLYSGNKLHYNESVLPEGSRVVALSTGGGGEDVGGRLAALRPDKVVEVGGAGRVTAMLLDGRVTHWLCPERATGKWDMCAAEALLRIAGGNLVDREGHNYDYSRGCRLGNEVGLVAVASQRAWKACVDAYGWR